MLPRKVVLLLGAVIFLPAGLLVALAIVSLLSEERLRAIEQRERDRSLAAAAVVEVEADLARRVEAERRRLISEPSASERVGALGEGEFRGESILLEDRVRRENPQAVALLDQAKEAEFVRRDGPSAVRLYEEAAREVENETTRGQLLLAAARCADKASAGELYERLESAPGVDETGIPIAIAAGVRRLALGVGDGSALIRHLRDAAPRLDPSQLAMLLRRIRIPVPDLKGRCAVWAWAQSRDRKEDWTVFAEGPTLGFLLDRQVVCALPLDRFPSDELKSKMLNLMGELAWEAGAGGEVLPVRGDLKVRIRHADPAEVTAATKQRTILLGSLLVLLVAAMSLGLFLALRAARREFRLAQLKSDFVSGISHELRTPLTSIRMFADLLADPAVTDEATRREYIELIAQEAARLQKLVENVLDFARLERGAFKFEKVDVRQVVKTAIESFRPARPEFRFDLDLPAEPLEAKLDAQAVTGAIHNLLDNAVKYSPEQAAANVVVRRDADCAVIEVRDRGIGIGAEERDRLFDKFFRGSHPLVRSVRGTGLGLAMVKHVVSAHRGRVGVASATDQGSTFSIEIPLCRES